VTRIQTLPSELLKTTYHCLSSLSAEQHSDLFQLRNDAFLTLNNLANSPPPPTESTFKNIPPSSVTESESPPSTHETKTSPPPPPPPPPQPRVILISSFLFPSHVITSLDRHISILLQNTLQTNLNNPFIDEIFLINQIEYNFSKLTNSQKLKQFILNRRVRYSDLFRLATNEVMMMSSNNSSSSHDFVIFASCDIVFDSTLSFLTSKHSVFFHHNDQQSNQTQTSTGTGTSTARSDLTPMIALTAWNSIADSNLFTLSVRIDKQDVWILRPPIDSRVISLSDFTLGSKKSDNRLANIFFESGYRYVKQILVLISSYIFSFFFPLLPPELKS
jgi:hypothetical protein